MSGKPVKAESVPGKGPSKNRLENYDMSVGNIDKSGGEEQIKTSGIKIRGTGAATKGVMARGPMA
jgi:hypothetical protein